MSSHLGPRHDHQLPSLRGERYIASMADEFEAARARMIAKRFGGAENVRTGGKGTVRRKRKAQHKASSTGVRLSASERCDLLFFLGGGAGRGGGVGWGWNALDAPLTVSSNPRQRTTRR